jgi:CheY-like chemotaxis protein
VASARTTHDALDVLRSWVPDVIVSDFTTTEEGRLIAGRATELRIPAIALTGHALPEQHARIIAIGFEMCVTKPFDPDALCLTIATRLGIAPT